MKKVVIGKNEANQRLDKFLRKFLGNAPLSYIYKAIRKDIKVNGKRAKEDTILELDDEVSIYISDQDIEGFQRKKERPHVKRQFKVVFEDENVLIVDKPFGLLTHGDKNEKKNHLANQVIDYLIEKGDYNPRIEKTFTPAPVNRLDRNTTGLVMFGKNNMAVQTLNQMIRDKDKVSKYYMTIVSGKLTKELHLVDKMVKDEDRNVIKVIDKDSEIGKSMETIARPLEGNNKFTLVEVEIITGRTHQIRAHLAKEGYPIIGDVKYGNKGVNRMAGERFDLSTQLLHAYRLVFNKGDGELEYLTGKEVLCRPPADFERIKNTIFDKNR